jgi:hypothetical protein
MALHAKQLIEPNRIFIGGSTGICGNAPSLHDVATIIDQSEFDVGIAIVDSEKHCSKPSSDKEDIGGVNGTDFTIRQAQLERTIICQPRKQTL